MVAAALCELAGADGITLHLREDRRHIQVARALMSGMQAAVAELRAAIAAGVGRG